jgi:hypothetical protein
MPRRALVAFVPQSARARLYSFCSRVQISYLRFMPIAAAIASASPPVRFRARRGSRPGRDADALARLCEALEIRIEAFDAIDLQSLLRLPRPLCNVSKQKPRAAIAGMLLQRLQPIFGRPTPDLGSAFGVDT